LAHNHFKHLDDVIKDGMNQITILTERKDMNEVGTGGIMGPVAVYRER